MMNLERRPSIRSCFQETFNAPSTSSSFKRREHEHEHDLLRSSSADSRGSNSPSPLPRSPVDKHLVEEQPGLSKAASRSSRSIKLPLPQTLPLYHHNPSAATHVHTQLKHEAHPIPPPPLHHPIPPPPLPSFLKIRNSSTRSLALYLPLYQAAMKGDWEEANEFLKSHPGAVNLRITKAMDTLLHIAAGARHTKFVEEVVKLLSPADLLSRNKYNNTALCYAAASGIVRIAQVMVSKNKHLPGIRGTKGVTPLHIAASFGHKDMVWYLYRLTNAQDLTQADHIALLIATIRADLFDVALDIIQHKPELASCRDPNGETAFDVLARKPSSFESTSGLGFFERVIYSWIHVELPSNSFPVPRSRDTKLNQVILHLVGQILRAIGVIAPGIKLVHDKKTIHRSAHELVKRLWDQVLLLDDSQISDLLKSPSKPLFSAAESGILEFVTVLIRSYPELIWKVDDQSRSIFHIAVLHRQEKIFNLIHDIGAHKDMITAYKDINNHNMLHLAAKVASLDDRISIVSGAALQMQHELLWFKEVERNMQPLHKEMRDKNGQTPRMLFREEHRLLVKEGEKWMKSTASSCMLVATLITTVMFAAIFTVPGGNDEHRGTPLFLGSKSFYVFAVSDAFALFSSVTSILMFLSILTSRYAEEDFVDSLLKRLVMGLVTLFCSIASMLVAFAATFFIVLGQRLAWVAVPLALVSCIPLLLFAFLQFPLLADMIHSLYGAGIYTYWMEPTLNRLILWVKCGFWLVFELSRYCAPLW